jgi:hypothetical protein
VIEQRGTARLPHAHALATYRHAVGWDGLPMNDRDGKRLAIAAALRHEFPNAIAVDASVAKGRAYVAYRDSDGTVRPMYLWLERDEFAGGEVIYKHVGLEESPIRWPSAVVNALTTWEP